MMNKNLFTKTVFVGYQRRDWLIAVVISLFILLIAGTQLTKGTSHIDAGDYAAYILTGKSIVDATYEEQIAKNYIMHPSTLPEEAVEGKLVYVWGYPLFLALVYHLVGLDLVNYSTIIFYKLPSLFAFALAAGILYLFYRRFFTDSISVFLALAFAASGNLMRLINWMYSDIVFLCLSCFTLWVAECFFDSFSVPESRRKVALLGIGLGVLFWLTYETRLNGNTLIMISAAAHVIRLFQRRPRLTYRLSQTIVHISPYLTFFLLKIISEAILLSATPNTSDIGDLTFEAILSNIDYYFDLTTGYMDGISGISNISLWPVLSIMLIIGLVKEGFTWKNIHLTFLLIGTYLVLILLPYEQGLRYLANILPILLLYISLGGIYIFQWIVQTLSVSKKQLKTVLLIFSILCLLCMYIPIINTGILNIHNDRQVGETDVYSADAIDLYRYVQEHTSVDDVIAYNKPRILSLNTGRLCIRPNRNGHIVEDADYYVYNSLLTRSMALHLEEGANMELCYENCYYSLYRIIKE